MEFGKQFTPSNSPPPPGYGQMWEGTNGVTPAEVCYSWRKLGRGGGTGQWTGSGCTPSPTCDREEG